MLVERKVQSNKSLCGTGGSSQKVLFIDLTLQLNIIVHQSLSSLSAQKMIIAKNVKMAFTMEVAAELHSAFQSMTI
jgi:hypothetical protein